jgi:hypothetical protein
MTTPTVIETHRNGNPIRPSAEQAPRCDSAAALKPSPSAGRGSAQTDAA